jgi:hypothetical protein
VSLECAPAIQKPTLWAFTKKILAALEHCCWKNYTSYANAWDHWKCVQALIIFTLHHLSSGCFPNSGCCWPSRRFVRLHYFFRSLLDCEWLHMSCFWLSGQVWYYSVVISSMVAISAHIIYGRLSLPFPFINSKDECKASRS